MWGWMAATIALLGCGGATGERAEPVTARDEPVGVAGEADVAMDGATTGPEDGSAVEPDAEASGPHPVLVAYARALAAFAQSDHPAPELDLSNTASGDDAMVSEHVAYCLFRGIGGPALEATRHADAREPGRAISALPDDPSAGRDAAESAHTRLEALSSAVSIERVRCGRARGARARRCEGRVDRLAAGVAAAWHLFSPVDARALGEAGGLVEPESAARAGLTRPLPVLLESACDAGLSRVEVARAVAHCLERAAAGTRSP